MGIKRRKVCFICKAGSSCWDVRWFVWIPSLPPSLPLASLLSRFVSWVLGWGGLWSLAEGCYGSISVALLWEVCSSIINLYERRQKDVNFAAATVAPVSVSQQWTWITFTVRGREKAFGTTATNTWDVKSIKLCLYYVSCVVIRDSMKDCKSMRPWTSAGSPYIVSYILLTP